MGQGPPAHRAAAASNVVSLHAARVLPAVASASAAAAGEAAAAVRPFALVVDEDGGVCRLWQSWGACNHTPRKESLCYRLRYTCERF